MAKQGYTEEDVDKLYEKRKRLSHAGQKALKPTKPKRKRRKLGVKKYVQAATGATAIKAGIEAGKKVRQLLARRKR